MNNHDLHQFCFVLLKAHPILPPLEARSRRFRVIALKIISKLLVSFLLQRRLQFADVLAQGGGLLFMFTDLLILSVDNISSIVLHRLEVWELLSVRVDPPKLYRLLLLTLIKILKDSFPVSSRYFMVVSECTERMIVLPQGPLVPGCHQMCSWFLIPLVLLVLGGEFFEPSKGIFAKPVSQLSQDLITPCLSCFVSFDLVSPSIERVLLNPQYILFEKLCILLLPDRANGLSLNLGLLRLSKTFIL